MLNAQSTTMQITSSRSVIHGTFSLRHVLRNLKLRVMVLLVKQDKLGKDLKLSIMFSQLHETVITL